MLLFIVAQLYHTSRMKRITLSSLETFSFGASMCFNASDRAFVEQQARVTVTQQSRDSHVTVT